MDGYKQIELVGPMFTSNFLVFMKLNNLEILTIIRMICCSGKLKSLVTIIRYKGW